MARRVDVERAKLIKSPYIFIQIKGLQQHNPREAGWQLALFRTVCLLSVGIKMATRERQRWLGCKLQSFSCRRLGIKKKEKKEVFSDEFYVRVFEIVASYGAWKINK